MRCVRCFRPRVCAVASVRADGAGLPCVPCFRMILHLRTRNPTSVGRGPEVNIRDVYWLLRRRSVTTYVRIADSHRPRARAVRRPQSPPLPLRTGHLHAARLHHGRRCTDLSIFGGRAGLAARRLGLRRDNLAELTWFDVRDLFGSKRIVTLECRECRENVGYTLLFRLIRPQTNLWASGSG